MKILINFFVLFILLFSAFAEGKSNGVSQDVLQTIIKVKDLALNREYDSAIQLLKKKIADNGNEATYPFALSVLYHIMMFEENNFTHEYVYKRLYERVKYLLENKKNKTAWDFLILGANYGMDGLLDLRKHERLSAISRGIKALKFINKAKKVDPSLIEADMPIGMHIYIRSRLSLDHFWLPFFSDKRDEGIRKIKAVKQKSKIIGEPSSYVLALIYKKERDWPRVVKEANELSQKYPNGIVSYLLHFMAAVHLNRFDEANKKIDRVLTLKDDYYLAHYLKGFLLFTKLHLVTESKIYFFTAYRKSTDNNLRALSAYQLSLIYEKEKNEESKREYQNIGRKLDSKIKKEDLTKIKIFY